MLKKVIRAWPWALTRNEKYDRETKAILKRICNPDSVCVDIGSYEGEILEQMISASPKGKHIAFEPIPYNFEKLRQKFHNKAEVYPYALGSESKECIFHHVVSNPTYSGLQRREYKRNENIVEIKVHQKRLDEVLPDGIPVHVIKIDVEGGEFGVLQGAIGTLKKSKPYLIFEHGLGGTDKYGVKPAELYALLVNDLGYRICLMQDYLQSSSTPGFSLVDFEDQFWGKKNYYFFAYHPSA